MALAPRSKMWPVDLAVLMLGLLVMAQHSMQQSLKNPFVKGSNCDPNDLSSLGLVLPSDRNEKVLLDSGLFKPNGIRPFVDIAGRRYHSGSINGHNVVYVKTGSYMVNAAAAVQTLIHNFRIRGIVHFGNAGSLNETLLRPGDVTAPEFVSFTGAWEWMKFGSNGGNLIFGEFNYPDNGENKLGSINYDTVPLYTPEGVTKDFYIPVTSDWVEAAAKGLADLELRRCYNGVCLPYRPEVVFNLKASTSDIYVKNTAYGQFLHNTFGMSSADQESAAVASVAMSNEMPYIVFRGISNSITSSTSRSQLSYLASDNAFRAAAKFIDLLPSPRLACA